MFTDTEIAEASQRRWTERFEQHLDQIPTLIEHLREHRIPLKAAELTERVSGGGGEAPVPFRLDPVDDADDLWSALAEYAGEVAEYLETALPVHATDVWATFKGPQGIPARLGADSARRMAHTIIGWLIDHATRIRPLELTDSEDHLFTLVRKLSAQYLIPPVDRKARRRLCRVCGEQAVVLSWLLGGTGEAECKNCGETYSPEGSEN